MTKTKTMRARRTKAKSTDSPTASSAPNSAAPPALPFEATKPLCDLVEADATSTIDAWHRAHVESVRRYQMTQGQRTAIVVLPPPKEALGLLSLLVQRAGIAERKAILQVIAPLVDGPLLGVITNALRIHRGPVADTLAVWAEVGKKADVSAYVMNIDTDYALAK